jgi:hypothetical protein
MSIASCVDLAVKAGKMSRETAERIKASDDPNLTIDEVLADLTEQKRSTALQAVKQAERWENIQSHPEGLLTGLMSILTKDITGKAGYANVEYRAKTYEARFLSRYADALSAFRSRTLGLTQDTERLDKLIRAIYGEAVDDPEVMKFAKEWAEITEEIRQTINKNGGNISKNEKWLMPQKHDAQALLKVGDTPEASKKIWKERVAPLLDREQMTDDFGNKLSDEQFDIALDKVYDTITTNGLSKLKDFTAPGMGKKLASRGSEKRFLYFKDAESWQKYQKEFGRGDIFTTLTDHITSKAHDIALMEMMGPNPEATFKTLFGMVQRDKRLSGPQKAMTQAVWNVVSGKINQGELTGLADFMQSTRNILTASTLGGAFLSSISDVAMIGLTTKYNNIPTFKTLSRQLSLLNPANEKDRIFAVKMGLMADSWTNMASAGNRYSDVFGTGPTAKVAEGVMRASLLEPWTDAGRKAFGMEFSSMLADNFSKSFGDLDKNVLRAFKTYGIDERDWNVFRKQKPLDFKGAKFADMTQDGGEKFHQMVMSETDYAVPTPDARVRAITTAGMGRATGLGQVWRSMMMLKSFPITIATTHLYRAAYQSTMGEKLAYSASLVAGMSALGGVALQAKDIAAGREPRPVDEKFFAAAVAQGGGLGIFGDYLFSDKNRFGGSLIETLAGPTGQLITKTEKLTIGNIQQAVAGEETNVLGEGVDFVRRYVPNIWPTRLFTDAVFDQIALMADPRMEKKFNRQMRKRTKEYGNDYWWRKGEILPEALQ